MVAKPIAASAQRSILTDALNHAQRGWPVFPVSKAGSGGKTPLTPHGHLDASTDAATVRQWFQTDYPGANCGIATGPAGLVVVDIDPRHDGAGAWKQLWHRIGQNPTRTMTIRTGGGGWHLYYLAPHGVEIRNSAGTLGAGLDVRAQGGYVVGPGSIHASGHLYIVLTGEVPPAPFPPGLMALLRTPPARPTFTRFRPQLDSGVLVEGGRNVALTRRAGRLRRQGWSEPQILDALLAMNTHECRPPLGEDEVQRIAHSVARYPAGSLRMSHRPLRVRGAPNG